jgi:hypothetical protein
MNAHLQSIAKVKNVCRKHYPQTRITELNKLFLKHQKTVHHAPIYTMHKNLLELFEFLSVSL